MMEHLDTPKRYIAPILSERILHREALVMKLKEAIVEQPLTEGKRSPHNKLVVLCAPAGYGKTTLLADFAHHTNHPCCWYFLDNTDVDKTRFLRSLILSIQHRFPHFGKALDFLLSSTITTGVHYLTQEHHLEAEVDALVTTITSEIAERFAIFLCNYHKVNTSQGVNEVVNQLLRKLPSQCVLVIESRAVPAIDFVSLLVKDEVMGFDQTVLRFTSAQIHDLARIYGVAPLREREAERLTALFDGWIAGILLGTQLGDRRMLHSHNDVYTFLSTPDVQIDRENLFAYLVNEVFSRDLEVYTFLKGSVVLQNMTPQLCDALLERTDAADCLQYLEQQGLFVTRSNDGSQVTWTCHPILRELLYDELRRQTPERFNSLHLRAMELWQAAHDLEQAIYHAFEACQYDSAAHFILEIHEDIFAQGRVEMLSHWIDAIPPETIMHYPQLLLERARIYLLLGEHTDVFPLLKRASEAITQQQASLDEDSTPLFRIIISILHCEVLFQSGEYVQAQELCRHVLEQIPADEVVLRAEAHTLLGVCANEVGDYSLGIAHLQKALQAWGRNSERWQTAKLHNTLGRTYGLIGNFALAEHHLARAARCWDRLQDEGGKLNNLLNMGMIKQHQGEFASAATLFQEALTIARGPIHFRRGEAYALVNLGDLYQDLGLYDQSLAVAEDGLALARQLNDKYLLNCALCVLAMAYLLTGDAETATLLISEVHLENYHGRSGGYEKATCELTYGTILLYQSRYGEAYTYLTRLESHLHTIGLQWDLLRTTLRITECLLRQGNTSEALHRIGAIDTLIFRSNYEQKVLRELHLLPNLERAIKTLPELVRLRTHLQAEITAEAEKQEESLPVSASPIANSVVTNKKRLKILALGEPTILIDEKPITRWRIARAMELFFLLLDNGRPLRKEQIILALWPETDSGINQKFHSTVHHLRKSLGEPCIVSRGSTYWLDLTSAYGDAVWYDVLTFQEHHTSAKVSLASKDDATARTELLAMLDLYQGDYVQSFYSDWCIPQRDKLRLAYLDAHQQLALIAWRNEQFDESAIHWQHILAVDDCLEEAHYGLMRCYVRQGKRGLALRQYQRCTEILRRELNVEPGPAMQNLLQQLIKRPATGQV